MGARVREVIAFACEGARLIGTLDLPITCFDKLSTNGGVNGLNPARPALVEGRVPHTPALLIVTGGNEVRAGAHRGMALLAARLAAEGTAVFRYDRRGTGDSEGENSGYANAAPDLCAAAAAFRAHLPAGTRLIGFGNCDAATLLAEEGRAAGLDGVILANPWTVEDADPLPPAAAIRAGYAAKLRDPREWWRLLRGGVNLAKLFSGLRKIARTRAQPDDLAARVHRAIASWGDAATVVLAEGDNTALAYAAGARGVRPHTVTIPTASHSFARAADQRALEAAIRAAIRRLP